MYAIGAGDFIFFFRYKSFKECFCHTIFWTQMPKSAKKIPKGMLLQNIIEGLELLTINRDLQN